MNLFDAVMQIGGLGIDFLNYRNQVNTLEYQKQMQEKQWQREDSAAQRRAADLRAAGLSPTLAAGGAAQTSAPINVGTPIYRADSLMRAVEYGQARRQNAVTEAQKNLIEEQADATDANSFYNKLVRDYVRLNNQKGGINDNVGWDLASSMIEQKKEEARQLKLANDISQWNKNEAIIAGLPIVPSALDAITQGKLIDNALNSPKDLSSAASPLANIARTIIQILKAR